MDTESYEWQNTPPENDGYFYYRGDVPSKEENLWVIIQIITDPASGKRWGCVFIPPWWCGDEKRDKPVVHFAPIDEWPGEWSGPEGGLVNISIGGAA